MSLARMICLAGALLSAGGCASSGTSSGAPSWAAARGADFMDIFGVRVAIGPGLGIYVRATRYAQLGMIRKGPGERNLPAPKGGSSRSVPYIAAGTIGRYGGLWFEESAEIMLPGWSSRDSGNRVAALYTIEREPIAGYVTPDGTRDNWDESFGGGVHLLLVGAEGEVRPYQLFDFFAGLFGYDPAGDDLGSDGSPAAAEADTSAENS